MRETRERTAEQTKVKSADPHGRAAWHEKVLLVSVSSASTGLRRGMDIENGHEYEYRKYIEYRNIENNGKSYLLY